MEDCEYCSDAFDDEDAYLDHLAAEHEGELGRIDRRRVADRDSSDGSGFELGPTVLVGLLVLAGALVVYVTFMMGGGGSDAGSGSARDVPDDPLLADAESFPSNGANHVSSDSDIDYERVPPLSGPHYSQAANADFYEERVPLGSLVHSLEHGYVVVYYDPGAITPGARADLQNLTATYDERWESVIAAPHPEDDPASAYVVTAWQVRLAMDEYDPETVRAFMNAFRGRGPENPVR